MKCAHASAFGNPADVLLMATDQHVPTVENGSGKVLIKVKACSLSPGDWRTIRGLASVIRHPPFPYIPGGDVCGTIVAIDSGDKQKGHGLKVGDEVVATWGEIALGGLAEYALADIKFTTHKPAAVGVLEAASLANSGCHARNVLAACGDVGGKRVLVLGGSGGVGTLLVQLLRRAGVGFLATTSTQDDLMRSLGVDICIDYRSVNWWELPDLRSEPLDMIIDLAEGYAGWQRSRQGALKSGWKGGRYIAVTMDTQRPPLHHYHQLFAIAGKTLGRLTWTRMASPSVPKWTPVISSTSAPLLTRVLEEVANGEIKAVLDPRGPFSFTEEGIKEAFALQDSMHAHGKVVVQISE